MDTKSEVPTGIKILSVIYYLGAVGVIFLGILLLIFVGFLTQFSQQVQYSLGGVIFYLIGVTVIGLGVFNFFLGRGLWKTQGWARITTIVLYTVGIIFNIIFSLILQGKGMFSGGIFFNSLVTILAYVAIILYLFKSNVVEAFQKK